MLAAAELKFRTEEMRIRLICAVVFSLAATAAFSQQSTNELLRDIKRQGMSKVDALQDKLDEINIKIWNQQRAMQHAPGAGFPDTPAPPVEYTGNRDGHTYECQSKINPGNIYLSYNVPCPSGTNVNRLP
jgi:hypothetical protein